MGSVKIVKDNAVESLRAFLLEHLNDKEFENKNIRYLQCRFFQIGKKTSAEDISKIVENIEFQDNAVLYVCEDGDLIFQSTEDSLESLVLAMDNIKRDFKEDIEQFMEVESFFVHFHKPKSFKKLELECLQKLKKQTQKSQELIRYFSDKNLVATFKKTMKLLQMQRVFRTQPHILIVDDQIFSQKILQKILDGYTTFVTDTAADALVLYIEKCPDIVFLDIELPNISGHHIAEFFNKIDEHAYIVMVTGNNSEKDIKVARHNEVRGFIVKPYEKDAILSVIEKYGKTKKKAV